MHPAPHSSQPSDFGLLHSAFCILHSVLTALLLFAATAPLPAQPISPPPRDPFMSLMISQPQIYITDTPTATASFDPTVVRPGGQAFYRVVFNALEESV